MVEASRTGEAPVIIPTFNEVQNIESIASWLRCSISEAHVLVVGDNSPDSTGKLVDAMIEQDDHVHVLHRKGKEGLGVAYLAGLRWNLERECSVLMEHDVDGSHQPEQSPGLLAALEHVDIVKGSRWAKDGSVANWSWTHKPLSRGGPFCTRLMFGVPYQGTMGGPDAFRADALAGIIGLPIDRRGYEIQRDLTWHVYRVGLRIVEAPTELVEREFGDFKMGGTVTREAIISTTKMGL